MHPVRQLGRPAIAIGLLALGAFGCDLIQSAQANRVLAASLLATPEYDFTQTVLDADAGLAVGDGGLLKLSGQTVVQVFFGEAPKSTTSQPKGVAGAQVTLEYSGKSFTLKDNGAGNYGLTSVDDAKLVYASGARYKLAISSGSDTFTATVTGPSSDDSTIEDFHVAPAGTPIDVTPGHDLKLTRLATDRVAFTTVIPINSGSSSQPTYTDLPTKAVDLVDLILNDAKWKQKVITIPGSSAFPTADTFYVVNVTAVEKGSTSNNLFTTSVFLAGTPDVGLVKTK